jgi:hypothetical protein
MIVQPVYIDDIIGEIVSDTANAVVIKPYTTLVQQITQNEINATGSSLIQGIRYSKSSFDELIETLSQEDKSSSGRFTKYPLVHLVQDMVINRGADTGIFGTATVNIIFVHQTQQNFKTEERDEKVFKPVLWPIYYQFLEQLKKNNWVFQTDTTTGEFPHRVIKRAFWGNRNLQGSKNILNDYVDAIEVQNLQLKINYSNCF